MLTTINLPPKISRMSQGNFKINEKQHFLHALEFRHKSSQSPLTWFNKNLNFKDTRVGHCLNQYINGTCLLPRKHPFARDACCCSYGAAWQASNETCHPCPSVHEPEFKKLCPFGAGYTKPDPDNPNQEAAHDLNECLVFDNLCENGICINTDGSYRCECMPGYTVNLTGIACEDINECLYNNPCGNGTCSNTIGGFLCDCNVGFKPSQDEVCEDINECLDGTHECAFRCHNLPGSYKCICPKNYQLSPDGFHCIDVDECALKIDKCPHVCKNLVGSFVCVCPPGYRQLPSGECEDIDECRVNPRICGNGDCKNRPGDYVCECYSGFRELKLQNDSHLCVDVRDGLCYDNRLCSTKPGETKPMNKMDCCCSLGVAWGPACEICPAYGTGEYFVLCPENSGHSPEGEDIDECQRFSNLCKNGKCINTPGSYRCLCNTGFDSNGSNGTKCVDRNECKLTPSPCDYDCVNTDGSYYCLCQSGYQLSSNSKNCIDVDECITGKNTCPKFCINTPGSYKCSCPAGYKQQGDNCLDINECENNLSICGENGQCVNTDGSYKCDCKTGYRLSVDGTSCVG